ncbi:MAG: M23 family metallopeptidase [Candidatus Woesearchaeota archaeon]
MINLLNKKQKKGQIYIVSLIITIIFALVSAFLIISFTSSEKSKDEYFGSYQSGMIDAITESDKTLIYLQQSAKYSVNNALKEYTESGAVSIIPENGEEYDYSPCKTYVYNLWNNQNEECFPHTQNFFGEYLRKILNEKLSQTDDLNLKKEIKYSYYYYSNISGSLFKAISNDKYTFYVFKSKEYKFNKDVKEYISQDQKIVDLQFSGTFVWPVPGYYSVSSCFGYRIVKDGSKYHGGLDIPTNGAKVPVIAAASGTIEELDPYRWGRVRINHGGGFITEYLHLHSINNQLKVGDKISQGQEIGIVGGRGPKGPNEYPVHLHFSIINKNIDPKTNNKGAPAVKIDGWYNKNINPACFLSDSIKNNNVQFDTSSLSCQSELRDEKGKIVDYYQGGPYKFCSLYGTIDTNINCQINDNTQWKITNFYVSKKEFSGDETVKITITIENPSDECVTLKNTLKFKSQLEKEYIYEDKRLFNVYKSNNEKKYFNIETECIFITDDKKLNEERKSGKCVLLAPIDNKIKYDLFLEVEDLKNRIEKDKKTTFEVSKPKTTGQEPEKKIELTKDEQQRIDITKKRLEKLNILNYIIEQSNKENVPPEIMLGLVTVESLGDINAVSQTGAQGLFQIIKTYHENKAKKECGSWDNFKKDAKCQVRVAIQILKENYRTYSKNGLLFKCSCKNNKNPDCKPINERYTGWEAAIRAYNSAGCHVWADNVFVEKVMRYAYGWGYSGTMAISNEYQQIAVDEIESKGIIGKYYVNPSFAVKVPFDFSLINNLSIFMNKTVNDCKTSTLGKEQCLDLKIKEFNDVTGKYYKDNGVNIVLTRECEENSDEKVFNEFIESVEDCALSSDFDCQCPLRKLKNIKIKISADEDKGVFTFEKSGITYEVNSFNKYLNDKNDLLEFEGSISNVNFYKKLDSLKMMSSNSNSCVTQKSKYRLCLKTGYFIEDYDGQSIVKENITLKFAIHIKDNDVPPPINGLELFNMKNSRNSIIISWDEPKINNNKIPDIKSYVVYFSDIVTDFNNDIYFIRRNVKHRTLDLTNGYEKIKNIDLTQEPECEIIQNKYCKFKYLITDIYGNNVKTELFEDKLYYITDKEKFFYIINGKDSYNDLKHEKDKYFVVTAIDFDGNEIDNINESQKIESGKNLKSIRPKDNLGAGFVNPTITINNNQIELTYNAPEVYINGEPLKEPLLYRAYADWECEPVLCSIKPPFNHIAESTTQSITIVKNPFLKKVGIIAVVKNNNIEAQYNKAFVSVIP